MGSALKRITVKCLALLMAISMALILISCGATERFVPIPTVVEQPKIPAAYLEPCKHSILVGENWSDSVNLIKRLQQDLKDCDGQLKLIKEWDDKKNELHLRSDSMGKR